MIRRFLFWTIFRSFDKLKLNSVAKEGQMNQMVKGLAWFGLFLSLWGLAIACDQPQARAKVPFSLKAVVLEGQDHEYVENAITARFLEDGAVFKQDGVTITGAVEWTTDETNKVVAIKLTCSGIREGNSSVAASAYVKRENIAAPIESAQWINQGTYVDRASRVVVDSFRRQLLQQQSYLPMQSAKPPLH